MLDFHFPIYTYQSAEGSHKYFSLFFNISKSILFKFFLMCMSLSIHVHLCVCASLSLDRYNPYQLGQGSMHLQFQYSYGEMGCGNRKSCKVMGELAWGACKIMGELAWGAWWQTTRDHVSRWRTRASQYPSLSSSLHMDGMACIHPHKHHIHIYVNVLLV